MENLNALIGSVNNIFWSYLLIVVLIGCALWFSFKTRFVQFRMLGEMFRIPFEKKEQKSAISSFEAFAVSLASRVGTGNLAGVATAIVVGGPGAVFWMWVMAIMGSASAFIESTLAQLYKTKGKDSYIGGPAYYIEKGLKKRWLGVLFAVLLTITFGFAFNSVQSNTLCAAFTKAFNVDQTVIGVIVTVLTLVVIFGGIRRIAHVSGVIVPVMALGYILLALFVIAMNINHIPYVIKTIVTSAFGFEQAIGGGIGAAVMQGVKRGLFSNEAGMGSAPNVAATAKTSHPVKQGLIQALGVFTDTLVICSCTAFIILFSDVPLDENNGIQLTQDALSTQVGSMGSYFVAIVLLFFAFTSIIGNYYYGEANIRYILKRRSNGVKTGILYLYRILVGVMVMVGAVVSLDLAWNMADITMGMMTLCNLIAILFLGKYAFRLLDDYTRQKKAGIKSPTFSKEKMPDIANDLESW